MNNILLIYLLSEILSTRTLVAILLICYILALSYWSDDAVVMAPGQPATIGKDALRKMLEMNTTIPGFEVNWEPKAAHVSESGDLAYSIGVNYMKMLDSLGNKITIFHKGVEVWKKQEDGSWKCVVDIFNKDPTLTSIK